MKRLGIVIVLLLLLLIGGGLTSLLIANDGGILPVLQQVSRPDASPTVIQSWKADQLFLLIGFILFNLIGMAVTIAVVLWLLDRGVRRSRAEETSAPTGRTARE